MNPVDKSSEQAATSQKQDVKGRLDYKFWIATKMDQLTSWALDRAEQLYEMGAYAFNFVKKFFLKKVMLHPTPQVSHATYEWHRNKIPSESRLKARFYRGWVAVLRWFSSHEWAQAVSLSVLLLLVLMGLHASTGFSSGMSIAYVLPIWLATRIGGTLAGLLSVGLSTIALVAVDAQSGLVKNSELFQNGLVRTITFLLVMIFIAQVEHQFQKAHKQATLDPLTGLMNRNNLSHIAHQAVQRAQNLGQPLQVAVIDCDRFKLLNDTFGHTFGDLALKTVARRLQECTGEAGYVARLGGDEFIVVFVNTSADEARRSLTLATQKFQRHMSCFGWYRSITFGLAEFKTDGTDFDSLVRVADTRLYENKTRATELATIQELASAVIEVPEKENASKVL